MGRVRFVQTIADLACEARAQRRAAADRVPCRPVRLHN
eukprot:gene12931-34911_t